MEINGGILAFIIILFIGNMWALFFIFYPSFILSPLRVMLRDLKRTEIAPVLYVLI